MKSSTLRYMYLSFYIACSYCLLINIALILKSVLSFLSCLLHTGSTIVLYNDTDEKPSVNTTFLMKKTEFSHFVAFCKKQPCKHASFLSDSATKLLLFAYATTLYATEKFFKFLKESRHKMHRALHQQAVTQCKLHLHALSNRRVMRANHNPHAPICRARKQYIQYSLPRLCIKISRRLICQQKQRPAK